MAFGQRFPVQFENGQKQYDEIFLSAQEEREQEQVA